MKLKDLAQVCGAKLEGDGDREIVDVARPDAAKPNQVCFISDKKYLPLLEKVKPGAVILQPGIALAQGTPALRVDDPDMAFSKAITALRGEPMRPAPGIAETAIIGQAFQMGDGTSVGAHCVFGTDVKLGRNVIIYPLCYIGDGVSIGDDTVIYPHVTILERCSIGKRCTLHPGVVIGADGFGFHFVAGKFVKAPQRGTVKIDDDVEIGANTTIDRARFDVTHVKGGSKLDNLVMVGHNTQIGNHCVIAGQSGLSGSVTLKDYVQLGGNVGIADHLTIGMGAKIAAKSGVMRDVDPGMKMAGLPADDGKAFMRRELAARKLPQALDELKDLQKIVMRLAQKVGLPKQGEEPEFEKADDSEEPEAGTVTRFLRNRPAPEAEDKA